MQTNAHVGSPSTLSDSFNNPPSLIQLPGRLAALPLTPAPFVVNVKDGRFSAYAYIFARTAADRRAGKLTRERERGRFVIAEMAPEEVFVGALDQGTTSTRFIIYDRSATAVASHQVEFTQIYPEAGWVEHDPLEILETVRTCMHEAVEKAKRAGKSVEKSLKAIGITNQRETSIIWSKSTGKPLYNAIVWMDVRNSSICRRLETKLSGGRSHFTNVCGLPISTYFSALKLVWLLENIPEVKIAIENKDALFGTVDSWLIWNLTGGVSGGVHVTDCSNAARTMLMDLHSLDWHKTTLDELGIPAEVLPKIISNSEVFGHIADGWPLHGVPLAGCLGDQHAAMLGQKCKKGEGKSTYGTGCFILLNTGEKVVSSQHGLLTTISYKLGPDRTCNYALEGSIAIAGAAVQWLRDSLGIIRTASEIEELAQTVANTGGVYFVPAFNGLFAPWWRDDARGVLVGITRFTNRGHIARAALESMCFQAKEVLKAMHADASTGGDFLLRVDGGAAVNNLLMQLQADILGAPVLRPADIETTALGAAYAAGLAVGIWTEETIFENDDNSKITMFYPEISETEREARYKSWSIAVDRSFGLADLA